MTYPSSYRLSVIEHVSTSCCIAGSNGEPDGKVQARHSREPSLLLWIQPRTGADAPHHHRFALDAAVSPRNNNNAWYDFGIASFFTSKSSAGSQLVGAKYSSDGTTGANLSFGYLPKRCLANEQYPEKEKSQNEQAQTSQATQKEPEENQKKITLFG